VHKLVYRLQKGILFQAKPKLFLVRILTGTLIGNPLKHPDHGQEVAAAEELSRRLFIGHCEPCRDAV
jgi:hypothetical protein